MLSHHDWRGLDVPESFRYPPLAIEVRGPYACFTRPEFTSERLSYAAITPPAAIGLLSSVFWKPQFRWVIDRIDVMAPVRWMTLRRNEAGTAITADHRRDGYLDVDSVVQQRMTSMLRDVRYRIHAHIWVHPQADEQDSAKWRDQFLRRVKRGQSFRTPFLGMREFHADVFPAGADAPMDWSEDLGIMLHSIGYEERTGKETYDWFEARADHGTIHVPRRGLIAAHNAEVKS